MLSFIQQTQQGSVSTLERGTVADNMVLQSFDLSLSCTDNLPPYIGDYVPSGATFYTDLDPTVYIQGKNDNVQN